MHVVAVFGSAHKGNSETLAEWCLEHLEEHGARVSRYPLRAMHYKGCILCNGCKTGSESCVLRDDLTPALEAVPGADVVLVSAPVWFLDVPSQLKAFFDRWYAFFQPKFWKNNYAARLPKGKQVVMALSQGQPEGFEDLLVRYNAVFTVMGFMPMHVIRGYGLRGPGEAARRDDLKAQARAVAARILNGQPPEHILPAYR
ncbi:MAG: flavodoxin family protein [Deltaproteobacteria bacterium]|jgi:multimeric flavodoxin WrbA|nr:flavodoxin family protein [Deltaproteobacteria bacterium]